MGAFSCGADKLRAGAGGNPPKSFLVFPPRLAHFEDADFRRETMQPGTKKLLRFLQSWVINTLAVLVAVLILHGHIQL